jgi:hypothetical protein
MLLLAVWKSVRIFLTTGHKTGMILPMVTDRKSKLLRTDERQEKTNIEHKIHEDA